MDFQKNVYDQFNEDEFILFELIVRNFDNYHWMTRKLITNTSYQVIYKLMDYFKSSFKILEPVEQADGKILIKFDES